MDLSKRTVLGIIRSSTNDDDTTDGCGSAIYLFTRGGKDCVATEAWAMKRLTSAHPRSRLPDIRTPLQLRLPHTLGFCSVSERVVATAIN